MELNSNPYFRYGINFAQTSSASGFLYSTVENQEVERNYARRKIDPHFFTYFDVMKIFDTKYCKNLSILFKLSFKYIALTKGNLINSHIF